MKTIPQHVLAILDEAEKDGLHLRLPGILSRKDYVAVNKVLEAAGGAWSKLSKAHVFPIDAADALEPLILTGEYATPKQDFGQFDTPPEIVSIVLARAGIKADMTILEPSAGLGNIAIPASLAANGVEVVAFEIDPKRYGQLTAKTENEHGDPGVIYTWDEDFLGAKPNEFDYLFDRVIMNPPFAKGADIAHVRHAYDFLKPGGRLVAIMSPGWRFRKDRKFTDFRHWTEGLNGEWEPLPDNSFAASGTNVSTGILTLDKPA